MSSRKQMIDVIVSGMSPESYQKRIEKQSDKGKMPLRTSVRNDQRKEQMSKKKIEVAPKEIDAAAIPVPQSQNTEVTVKKANIDEFWQGTLNRMQCKDDQRKQNLQILKKNIFEENSKDCSFAPTITKSSSKLA